MLFSGRTPQKNSGLIFAEGSDTQQLELTCKNIEKILGENADIVFRKICVGGNAEYPLNLVFFDGLANLTYVSDYIIKPLMVNSKIAQAQNARDILDVISSGDIYYAEQKIVDDIDQVIDGIISGGTALIFDDEKTAVLFNTRGYEKRAISDPLSENVTKGARDSFVETLRVNTSLVRRKIKTPNLVIEQTTVGKRTLTEVAIFYIKGLTDMDIVEEVKRRLNAIDVDNVLATGFIEEYLSDDPSCSFPQLQSTERPDKFSADIVEGRVGIVIDGLPVAFVVPAVLVQFLQASDDYSRNYLIASTIRLMRFFLAFLTLILPGFYIAVTTFHQEMIPTVLALSIAKAKTGVAFPTFIEVLIMLIAFEVLLEAGKRIPRNIGQAVTIVGALIVGQAAVEAKMVSPVVVVVIAATAIFSFVIPDQDFGNSLRLWRFILAAFSSLLGLYGLIIGLIMMIHSLSKLESFGVPYLAPFVSSEKVTLQDTFLRLPLKMQKQRPEYLQTENVQRKD